MEKPVNQRKGSTLFKVALIVVGLGIISSVVQQRSTPSKSAAELEREKALDSADHKRRAAAFATAKVLRDLMRDPDSFVIESVSVNEDATLTCTEYRSRNGFGGMNREFVVIVNGKPSFKDATLWNKRCTKPLYDLTTVAKTAN